MRRPVVVKLGGSLLDWPDFPDRVRVVLRFFAAYPCIVVVGGGKSADVVRALDSAHAIGENRSHALALRALDLTAAVVEALVEGLVVVERPGEVERAWEAGQTPVLAPRWFMEHVDAASSDPLPRTWAVTTDSIAARVATYFGARELALLKSTAPETDTDRRSACGLGLVDSEFLTSSSRLPRVSVWDLRETPVRSIILT